MTNIERDDPWLDRLSDYLDEDLSAEERAELERHLAVCSECLAALGELRQVVARAVRMERDAVPTRDLWPAIEPRLAPRGTGLTVPGRRFRLGLAAAALFVLACAVLVWILAWPHPQQERQASTADTAEREYERTVAGLQREARERLTLDPHVVEVLDDNLAALDSAIATYREALSRDPADRHLRARLHDARRRKLQVLQQAVALTTDSNE